jgi:glutathione S-transferase
VIRLYGVPWSRASRSLWLLEEIGVDYENVPVAGDELRTSEFLALNPNGRIPTLVDGEIVLWESMAINLYLAKTYSTGLTPRPGSEEAHAVKWSFWAMSEIEAVFNHTASMEVLPSEWRPRVLGALNRSLSDQDYLLGTRFTVADLNVAAMFGGPLSSQLDLREFSRANEWLEQCRSRPALQRVYGMIAEGLARSSRSRDI